MAELWKLPVVFVIENNQYAMGTSVARHLLTRFLGTRGAAYGIKGEAVDGMDVLEPSRPRARRPWSTAARARGPTSSR
jgi:TPP-dependent pyruvate/acetoin dehydrogenase alpha subunit